MFCTRRLFREGPNFLVDRPTNASHARLCVAEECTVERVFAEATCQDQSVQGLNADLRCLKPIIERKGRKMPNEWTLKDKLQSNLRVKKKKSGKR
jgi:hypothetical protein